MSYGPFSITHNEKGEVIFIENACPGDEVEAEIYDQRKGFSYANISKIINLSELRNPNPKCKLHKVFKFVSLIIFL